MSDTDPRDDEAIAGDAFDIDAKIDNLAPSVFEALEKTAVQKEAAAPTMPAFGFDTLDSTVDAKVDATVDWMNKPVDERKSISIAHGEIERRKAEAKALGITLADREAITQTERLNRPAPATSPGLTRAAEMYPNHTPDEIVTRWADIDRYVQANPQQGLRWLAGELGVDLNSLAGGQQGVSSVQSAVEQFLGKNTDAEKYISDIAGMVQSRDFQRSGNPLADLETAFKQVKRQKFGRKNDTRPAWERTMDGMKA